MSRKPRASSPLWIALLAAAVCLGLLLPASGTGAAGDWPWPRVLFGAAALAFPVALMAFGARRAGKPGRIGAVLGALLLLLEGSYFALLLLRGGEAELLGLPAGLVVMLGGLWLLPLLLTSLGHGLTFDDSGLAPEELRRLRSLADRGAAAPGEPSREDGSGES